jgi:Ca2+-binding EF-hand superfamily protein
LEWLSVQQKKDIPMTSRSPTLVQMLNRTAAIVALSSAAWGVCAQTTAEPSAKDKTALEAAFTRADANGDNKLSKDEAARLPAISARFAELDKNKDGSLSLAEFAVGFTAAQ